MWDTRCLRGPEETITTLRTHTDAIIRLEWHPHCRVGPAGAGLGGAGLGWPGRLVLGNDELQESC